MIAFLSSSFLQASGHELPKGVAEVGIHAPHAETSCISSRHPLLLRAPGMFEIEWTAHDSGAMASGELLQLHVGGLAGESCLTCAAAKSADEASKLQADFDALVRSLLPDLRTVEGALVLRRIPGELRARGRATLIARSPKAGAVIKGMAPTCTIQLVDGGGRPATSGQELIFESSLSRLAPEAANFPAVVEVSEYERIVLPVLVENSDFPVNVEPRRLDLLEREVGGSASCSVLVRATEVSWLRLDVLSIPACIRVEVRDASETYARLEVAETLEARTLHRCLDPKLQFELAAEPRLLTVSLPLRHSPSRQRSSASDLPQLALGRPGESLELWEDGSGQIVLWNPMRVPCLRDRLHGETVFLGEYEFSMVEREVRVVELPLASGARAAVWMRSSVETTCGTRPFHGLCK